MVYSSDDIKKILPHRSPMLMIDKIVELVDGEYAVGIKNISVSDPVFVGHFPDMHVYPGALLVESMAQVGAVAILSKEENQGKKALFTRIKNAKFSKQVIPGDTLVIKTTLISMKLNIGFADSVITRDGEVVAKAEIGFAIVD